jgi:hypothetical protein
VSMSESRRRPKWVESEVSASARGPRHVTISLFPAPFPCRMCHVLSRSFSLLPWGWLLSMTGEKDECGIYEIPLVNNGKVTAKLVGILPSVLFRNSDSPSTSTQIYYFSSTYEVTKGNSNHRTLESFSDFRALFSSSVSL